MYTKKVVVNKFTFIQLYKYSYALMRVEDQRHVSRKKNFKMFNLIADGMFITIIIIIII